MKFKIIMLHFILLLIFSSGCSRNFIHWYELNVVGKDLVITQEYLEKVGVEGLWDEEFCCIHIATIGALAAQDMGFPYEIWGGPFDVGPSGHAQTRIYIDGKWYWLQLVSQYSTFHSSEVIISTGFQEPFKPKIRLSLEQAIKECNDRKD